MKKIMIIDDTEDDRALLTRWLKKSFESLVSSGQDVIMPEIIEAGDAEHAWEILTREKIVPDFLVVDFEMPRMNGGQLIRKIQEELNLNSKIAMLSSHCLAQEKAEQLGCHFVSKADGHKKIAELAVREGLFSSDNA